MKLEAVGGVSVGNMRLEICRQIDDVDSAKWTLLRADTTSNTQALGDKGNL
jgi:hypothetical protein